MEYKNQTENRAFREMLNIAAFPNCLDPEILGEILRYFPEDQ